MTSPKIIAVVPAYNEARTIHDIVKGIKPHAAEVIVVDDASSDATSREAVRAGATVLRHEVNAGYDGSLNDGFRVAYESGADIIFTFDADGEHDPHDIPRVLRPILSGEADIVAGERPGSRHWAERIFMAYTHARFGIRDPLCGFKAYRREVYEAVGFFDRKQSIGTELMLRSLRRGFQLVCVPVTLHARTRDRSRFYAFDIQGNLRIVRAMLRVLFV